MNLEIVTPSATILNKENVIRIVAESKSGHFGILPRRLDCVACLVPGIFFYETKEEGEKVVAIDEGILVKVDGQVRLAVRNAYEVKDLESLEADFIDQLLKVSEQEKHVRITTEKLAKQLYLNLIEGLRIK